MNDERAPADLEAEAAVLSAVMLDPSALAKIPDLVPEDFDSEAHRRVFESCRRVAARGDAPDVVLVAGDLRDRGRLEQVGGAGYLQTILDRSPSTAHVSSHAERIRQKAHARAVAKATLAAHARARLEQGDPTEVGGALAAELAALDQRYRPTRHATAGDHVRALARRGPVVRLETGIGILDRSCRGGLPIPRLVIIGGAPSAGKTSLAVSIAWPWARGGIPVGMLAQDEGPEGLYMRIGQLEGLDQTQLELREAKAFDALATRLDASALLVFDGDEADGTLEVAAARLAARAGERPAVLVVDSIQTVRACGTDDATSPRERVDAVVRSLKRIRDRYGLLVIATCELARASYSGGDAEPRSDLSAFKESGSIEYAMQTGLVLRPDLDPETKIPTGIVRVAVPKNRAYSRTPFALRMDPLTTAFRETEAPATPSRPPRSHRRGARSTNGSPTNWYDDDD